MEQPPHRVEVPAQFLPRPPLLRGEADGILPEPGPVLQALHHPHLGDPGGQREIHLRGGGGWQPNCQVRGHPHRASAPLQAGGPRPLLGHHRQPHGAALLRGGGVPPPTFRWYKDGVLLPPDPRTSPLFRNSSYTLDPTTGELIFDPLSGFDTGDYNCEATNNVGPPQESDVFRLEASEVNVGGIVAAVVVLLMVVALVAFGIWFGYSRGYFSKKKDSSSKKVIYSQASHRSEGEFKQTSSFLV